jgi:hypothetical protein
VIAQTLRKNDAVRNRVAAALCLTVAVSCGPRDQLYNPSSFSVHGTLAPPDVRVPAGAHGEYDGLYLLPADSLSAQLCCWIGPRATLRVMKHAPAKSLQIGTYVPEVPLFRAGGQSLTVRMAGRPGFAIRKLMPGFHMSLVPVPKGLVSVTGIVRVQLSSSVVYVPSPGGSAPHYGVLLLSAYFR